MNYLYCLHPVVCHDLWTLKPGIGTTQKQTSADKKYTTHSKEKETQSRHHIQEDKKKHI
jgi:hypothetical protein